MTFVRAGKMSMGPRGRNTVLQGAVQGYVNDDHAFTRGPGAIAALDAASPRRRLARAKKLAADARRDQARARVAMGAVPIAAAAKLVGKTLLPGMKIASALRPGMPQPSYSSAARAYSPVTFGAPGPQGVTGTGKVMHYAGIGTGRVGKVFTYAGPPIFGIRNTGSMSPGQITIPGTTAPVVGTTSTPIDTSSGGGGGGGSPIDDGGGDTVPTDIDTTNPDDGLLTESGGDVSQIASQTTPAAPPAIPLDTTTSPDNTTRNWLLAGAAVLGAYWLFKKKR